jgi:flagellar FliL protein
MADEDDNRELEEEPLTSNVSEPKNIIEKVLKIIKNLYEEKKIIFFAIVGVILFLILGLLFYFLYWKPTHSEKKDEEVAIQTVSGYIPLNDFKLRLKKGHEGKVGLLVIGLTLKLPAKAKAEEYKKFEPDIVDTIQTYLSSLKADDFSANKVNWFNSPVGLERLRYHLTMRVNLAIAPLTVETVLYRKLIVQ